MKASSRSKFWVNTHSLSNGKCSKYKSLTMLFLIPCISRELLDKEEQSVIVFINFSNATETVNLKKAFSDLPDLFTVELTGLSSVFKQGHQVSFDSDLELKKFESVVAFYNSSIALIVSNATIIMLIASLLLNFSR